MKKFFLMAAMVAFLASVGTGCKKDPCEKAMNKLAEMTGKAGEKAPDEEQKKKFLEQCKAWPDDVKNCLGDASDEAAIGACMQKVMQIEMEKAMKEAEKAGEEAKKAAEKATEEAGKAAEEAKPE
jgi:hypothetical protein